MLPMQFMENCLSLEGTTNERTKDDWCSDVQGHQKTHYMWPPAEEDDRDAGCLGGDIGCVHLVKRSDLSDHECVGASVTISELGRAL